MSDCLKASLCAFGWLRRPVISLIEPLIEMRILALRPQGFVLPYIHDSMVRAFRSLGVDVFELPLFQSRNEIHLLRSLARRDFEFVFTLDLGGDPDFTLHLREIQGSLRIPWVIWFVDDPEGYGFPEVCEPGWTVGFCWDREIVRQISLKVSANGISLAYLPLAADPAVFFPEEKEGNILYPGGIFVGTTAYPNELLEKIAETTPGFMEDVEALWGIYKQDLTKSVHLLATDYLVEKTGYDLGRIREEGICRLWIQAVVHQLGMVKRREIVSWVIEKGGGVFGDTQWRNIQGDLFFGPAQYGEELRKLYNRTSFVLDIRQPQARTGITQRIFDASACGRPVLTESSTELETLFDPGEELLCFSHLEEAKEMKNRCLRDWKEAGRRAEKARLRVMAHHTYRHRAARILELRRREFSNIM